MHTLVCTTMLPSPPLCSILTELAPNQKRGAFPRPRARRMLSNCGVCTAYSDRCSVANVE